MTKNTSITFNGKTFLKLRPADHGAGVDAGIHGYFRKNRGGILLYKPNGQLEAFVHKDGFIVSASIDSGRPRYMYGTSESTEKWLGIFRPSMAEEKAMANEALAQLA